MPLLFAENHRHRRPIDDLEEFITLMYATWILPRPTMALADSDPAHMKSYLAGELDEKLEELDTSKLDVPAYESEAVDFLVIVGALALNSGLTPDYQKVARRTNGQAPTDTLLLAQIEPILAEAWPDADSIEYDPAALKAQIETIFVLLFSSIHHGPGFAHAHSFMEALRKVIQKNIRNYPEQYFKEWHWLHCTALSKEQMLASYYHAVAALRLIRRYTGNKPQGLDTEDHQPFAVYIYDFEHSAEALKELEGHLHTRANGALHQPKYVPTWYQQAEHSFLTPISI